MPHSSIHFSFEDFFDEKSALHQLTPPARLGLLGTPVDHSRSPEIHNRRIKELQLPWQYVAIDVKAEDLPQALEFLRHSHFIGFNLTMPHKQKALELVQRGQSQYGDEVTDHACLLGGINTMIINNGNLFGINTDGPGFVAALREEWHFSLRDASLLILGASGGAGRALAMQAALEGCRQLFLGSRTPMFLQEQVASLLQVRPDLSIETIAFEEPSLQKAMASVDLVVNATPLGFLDIDVPSPISAELFQPRHYAYDIIYASKLTPLMQAACQARAHFADGSSMVRHQGALAFQAWLESPSANL